MITISSENNTSLHDCNIKITKVHNDNLHPMHPSDLMKSTWNTEIWNIRHSYRSSQQGKKHLTVNQKQTILYPYF